jgi:hypothetical protein
VRLALLERVPDVRQKTLYSCGPSSLEAVLEYYGVECTEAELIAESETDPEIGAEIDRLAEVARRRGLETWLAENFAIEDLEREVRAGHPVIVLTQSWRTNPQTPWRQDWDDGHYLVVIGIDPWFVYVEDPSLEDARGFIPREEFLDRWHCWNMEGERAFRQALVVRGRPAARAPERTPARLERVE